MTKIAIFTEGQTELLFTCEVIKQLAESSRIFIRSHRKNGRGDKLIKIDLGSEGDEHDHKFYFQILDCGSDEQVLPTIVDEYETLVSADFSHIIGLRDLHPHAREDLHKLQASIKKFSPKGCIEPLIVISVMEVEAWFIAENCHFPKIDETLTVRSIKEQKSIDVELNSETFDSPSVTLDEIYQLVGKSYGKAKAEVLETVGALDVREYFGSAGARAETVKPFVGRIREIFAAN
ncbi:hypothetical protein [Roseibium album]|uniref:hypothetical protein n=1 Tax=Roseibium album TaxID=311410 RepID=UPI00391CD194